MSDAHRLAALLADALEGHGQADFEAALAPGAIVWHNADRAEVDAVENMVRITALTELVNDLKCETVYLAPTPDGFVYQFVVRGTVASNGKPFEMQNCVVAATADGKYTRLDEYVDPTLATQFI